MRRPVIFILESGSQEDHDAGRREGPVLRGLMPLLDMDCECRSVQNLTEYRQAVDEFNGDGYCILHISAHACAEGFGLTDGTLIAWDRLFRDVDFKSSKGTGLCLSACSTMGKDSSLIEIASAIPVRPQWIFGYDKDVSWTRSASASVSLYEAILHKNHADLAAALAGIRLTTTLNMWLYTRNLFTQEYDFLSGDMVLRRLVGEPADLADPGEWRENLLVRRGLLETEAV